MMGDPADRWELAKGEAILLVYLRSHSRHNFGLTLESRLEVGLSCAPEK